MALGHQDPPGATATGVNLTLQAFRSDGVTLIPPGGSVNGCGETIIYRSTLAWAGGSNAAIQGGTLNIRTPDLVLHDATPLGGIPCLGGTDGVICTPGVNSIVSMDVPYVVTLDPACTPPTDPLNAVTSYLNGTAHTGDPDAVGVVNALVGLPLVVTCCAPTPTPTPTFTNTPTSTPTGTPTSTPTNTPTGLPTNTPTPTNTPSTAPPPVPTLSFPMMALLGLLLAGTGLFLARRL